MDYGAQFTVLQLMQGTGVEEVRDAVDRIYQRYVMCDASIQIHHELLELKQKLHAPAVSVDTLCEVANHLLRRPLSSEDRELLSALLPTILSIRLLYVTAQIVEEWDQQRIPYGTAIMEARMVLDSFVSSPQSALQRFLKSPHAASTLRSLHEYVTTHSPAGSENEAYWLELQTKAVTLQLAAEICDKMEER